ncbi:helix-turn-helix domain-containing protein [Nocardioides coralli]|uniref:helix-turn-helix domain-containing protein n=1 Tax=Nocardioides coralli TaxID=2872154 RepID=UPI001CA41A93|nr:helix-turn-helix transcriptional regulator [Nocardioides coralli]QZY28882.1 helix-turn-helix transcriptional regulator [Nocardioides coralli]
MTARDHQRALDKVARISAQAGDLATLWTGVTEVLADTIPFYWTPCFYTVDPASILVTSHFHDGLAEFPAEWLRQEYDGQDVHTIADVVASPSGVTTLHEVTGGEPRSTRRWQQNIELGGDQEMLARLRTRSGETWGVVGLYREPDRPLFDAADQTFLREASPALADGVRRALLLGEATEPQWPDSPGLVILGPDLEVDSLSPGAEEWLDELADSGPGHLPPAVLSVAKAAVAGAAAGEVSMARALSRHGAWVVLHGAPLRGDVDGRVAVIIEPANPDRILPLLMSVYGLTEREKQVVGLVLQGLPTARIAGRLFVSTSTVQQHLTSIFDKVGVRSRGDLVARLFFTHYEPRFRDNEHRTSAQLPMRGGPEPAGEAAGPP